MIIFLSWNVSGQNFYLKIYSKSEFELKIIDSVGFEKKHKNLKSIDNESDLTLNKLNKLGFIDSQISNKTKINDSIYQQEFDLGKKIHLLHIYTGEKSELRKLGIYDFQKDTLKIKYREIEIFLQNCIKKLEQKGFALSKLRLTNIIRKNDLLQAELFLSLDKERNLNEIVINGYDKFPEGFKKQINKKHNRKVFNKDNLKNIYNDFNKMRFVKQIKYPEILFTIDSTKVFVYVEKAKTSAFDGFIGFANDDNKNLIFNGYVDLALNNALNIGEKLELYWKSDGKNQRTFNIGTEIPFVFKTLISLKAQLNIFRQDSIFQNTKTNIDFGYNLNFNSKIYLGYQETESNDIGNLNTLNLSDSKNSFLTTAFEFIDLNNNDFLFPEKTNINFKIGSGQRYSKTQNDKQFFGQLTINHHFYLNKHNAINLRSQNFYLASNNFLTNELFRFGGINSIRGFNENSLQGNIFLGLMTEYQYVVSNSLYFHSVLDYGYFNDKASSSTDKLLGVGFGFGLINKNGLLRFIYSNGSTSNQVIKTSNSIVQISLKTNF